MYLINKNSLNFLEKKIYSILYDEIRKNDKLSITEAAELSGCSPSKISKFVHKLGFKNYKEYSNFINGNLFSFVSEEKERLKIFLDHFDLEIVNNFINYFEQFEKIILFGYGPSLIISQYFEYKLRIISDLPVWTVTDEASINSLLSKNTLVIVFSVTGQFKSFKPLYDNVTSKKGKVAFILEEGCIDFMGMYDFVIVLTRYIQNPQLIPHEKTRTLFFIFIEAIINQMKESSIIKDKKLSKKQFR